MSWICILSICLLCCVREGLSLTAFGKGTATTSDYKVKIEARGVFCFFQHAYGNSVFHLDFRVIRGGADSHASFLIKDPTGLIVHPDEWKQKTSYDTDRALEGQYTICISNAYSNNDIVVNVFMSTYDKEGWDRYIAEAEEMHVNGKQLVTSLSETARRVSEILWHLNQARSNEAIDYGMLLLKDYNVAFWSVTQCVIIILSGVLQIYIIRKLFQENPKGKFSTRL